MLCLVYAFYSPANLSINQTWLSWLAGSILHWLPRTRVPNRNYREVACLESHRQPANFTLIDTINTSRSVQIARKLQSAHIFKFVLSKNMIIQVHCILLSNVWQQFNDKQLPKPTLTWFVDWMITLWPLLALYILHVYALGLHNSSHLVPHICVSDSGQQWFK